MKKLALILVMGTLVSFYADAGRKPVLFERGDLTLYGRRQNLSVMMVLLRCIRKKHALTEV